LTPKSFASLQYLVVQPGQLVTKEALLGAVWPETAVSEAVLTALPWFQCQVSEPPDKADMASVVTLRVRANHTGFPP
jgi:hypothetical protein